MVFSSSSKVPFNPTVPSVTAPSSSWSRMNSSISQLFYQQPNSNPGKPFDLQISPQNPIVPGQPNFLNIQIYNRNTGKRPSQFQIVHEKPAHIFIVSQDLSDFQHVHPEKVGSGFLQVPVTFKAPGPYKMFIQFTTPEEGEQTLNKPMEIGRATLPPKRMVPDAYLPKQVDGFTYRVSNLPTRQQSMSMFKVDITTKEGIPVHDIQPFLGAAAHGVIISQDTNSFLHTHPMTTALADGKYPSPVTFHTEIKQPGLYKLWVQTMLNDSLHTVDWTFQV
jgi:hypothetical protein